MIVTAAAVAGLLGCAQWPSVPAPVVEDKAYTVTLAAMSVKAGIVTGEVTEMKVTERVEKGSGGVIAPAKLTGKVVLENGSANQTLRLVTGKIQYIDTQGQPIKLEETRTESALKFPTSLDQEETVTSPCRSVEASKSRGWFPSGSHLRLRLGSLQGFVFVHAQPADAPELSSLSEPGSSFFTGSGRTRCDRWRDRGPGLGNFA
jgi:hypothetical protein